MDRNVLTIRFDFNDGLVLPDLHLEDWAASVLDDLDDDDVEIVIGGSTMFTALRVAVQRVGIHTDNIQVFNMAGEECSRGGQHRPYTLGLQTWPDETRLESVWIRELMRGPKNEQDV